MKRLSVMLITVAMIAGMIACGPTPTLQYQLTITSTAGGWVSTPGEGTFTFDAGTVVPLMAEAEEDYRFVEWTGDVDTVGNVNAASTAVIVNGKYSVTANFEEIPHMGAWLDGVTIVLEGGDPAQAVLKLGLGELDLYACNTIDSRLYTEMLTDPSLTSTSGVSPVFDFAFNPAGPAVAATGKLNPFAVPAIREAMNWLIDRDYIVGSITRGLGLPIYTCLNPMFPDGRRYGDLLADVAAYYAHDATRATDIIAMEMAGLGALWEDGWWTYNGEQVELIFLIRVDIDERKQIGDYFAGLLESLGFSVIRQYGTSAELHAIWRLGDPALGKWHISTGGWYNMGISRDSGSNFGYFYTDLGSSLGALWTAYGHNQTFFTEAEKLWTNDFATMTERRTLFEKCLWESMKNSVRIFVSTPRWFAPMRSDLRLAADLAGGVQNSPMWALTAHFIDDSGAPTVGGTVTAAVPDICGQPWNPVAGSTGVHDMFVMCALSDRGVQYDTRDGLRWPGRIDRAEIVVQKGLPVGVTHDWLTLEFVPEIVVPSDAWADWDAVKQEFITAGQKTDPESPYYDADYSAKALRKSTVRYPDDLFAVRFHDGNRLSMGDFAMGMIVLLDRGKRDSPVHDPGQESGLEAFLDTFKGVRIVSIEPNLVIETYSDLWYLDAECNVTSWFPAYGTYYPEVHGLAGWSGSWNMIAVGWLAEANKELAFSRGKAAILGVKWMDYTRGASLPILQKWLDWATVENYIPYMPTLGQYISADEAAERWANMQDWCDMSGHFWVGNGPFYLKRVDPVGKTVHLVRFEDYPDRANRWLFLLEPLP